MKCPFIRVDFYIVNYSYFSCKNYSNLHFSLRYFRSETFLGCLRNLFQLYKDDFQLLFGGEKIGRESVIFSHLLNPFCQVGLNKTTHDLSQDSWYLDRGLYLGHGEYNAGRITGLSWTRTQGWQEALRPSCKMWNSVTFCTKRCFQNLYDIRLLHLYNRITTSQPCPTPTSLIY